MCDHSVNIFLLLDSKCYQDTAWFWLPLYPQPLTCAFGIMQLLRNDSQKEWMKNEQITSHSDIYFLWLLLTWPLPCISIEPFMRWISIWLFIRWVLLSPQPLDHHSFPPLNLLQLFQIWFLLWAFRTRMLWEISVWGVGRHHSHRVCLLSKTMHLDLQEGPVGFVPEVTISICF